ncbi:MAG: DUF4349 domain-containing protein [Gemmatimonadaceae bacterium]
MASRFQLWLAIPCFVLLEACGPAGDRARSSPAASAIVAPMPTADAAPQALGTIAQAGSTPSVSSFWDAQKLIRSAELEIEVKDIQSSMHLADSIVRQHGALLADSKLSQDADGRRQAELSIRVPSDSFANTVATLRQLGDVRSEAVNTQDVTKEYTDLQTRLTVKEEEVGRLRSLLNERTAKLTDVLDVERELARAVTELEQMKGEQRYYDQQIALSSITLTLTDRTRSIGAQVTAPVGRALRASFGVIGTSLSAMVYVVALLLPWAILGLVIWWVSMRVRARLRAPRK